MTSPKKSSSTSLEHLWTTAKSSIFTSQEVKTMATNSAVSFTSTFSQKTRSQQPCQNPANRSWATEDNESNSPTKINTDRGPWTQTLSQVSDEATTSTVQEVDEKDEMDDQKNEKNSVTTGGRAEELDQLDRADSVMIETVAEVVDSVAIETVVEVEDTTVTTENQGKPDLLDGDRLLVRWLKGRV
jgi:hypothetical protein